MKKHSFAIKVCGITRQSDLSTAMGMGAHFCGFIFHPKSPRYIAPSRAAALEKVIRVLWPDRYESLDALQKEMELWADSCAWFLLDAGSQSGGHGVSLDWNALASLKSPRPWFLAGGLSSASLNKALEQCTPNGIDLNSGVEAIPGQKSPQKLLAALKSLISYTPYHIA